MNRLRIDAQWLAMALEDNDPESCHYLDRQTGEILFANPNADTQEVEAVVEAEPERYLLIDPVPSSVGWNILQEFVAQLSEGEAQEWLARAIQGDRPFRRFKDTLLDYPVVGEAWFHYHQQALLQLARKWLEDEGIEAELRRSGESRPA